MWLMEVDSWWREEKVAVTDALALRVTVQAPEPLQAPDQPPKPEPALGAADKVRAVPLGKVAVQVDPQLMPAGVLVMVPAPPPAVWTVNWKFSAGGGAWALKVAVTAALALRVTVQGPEPLHAPDHPPKVDPALGVADKVTAVPLGKVAVQVDPQLMPAGVLVMVPAPPPAVWTV